MLKVRTDDNPADILTKSLRPEVFGRHLKHRQRQGNHGTEATGGRRGGPLGADRPRVEAPAQQAQEWRTESWKRERRFQSDEGEVPGRRELRDRRPVEDA